MDENLLKQIAEDIRFVKREVVEMKMDIEEINMDLHEVRPEFIEKIKNIEKEGEFVSREEFEKELGD